MPVFFLTPEQAREHAPLRALLDVGSFAIDEYAAPFAALLRSGFVSQLVVDTLANLERDATRVDATAEDADWRLLLTEHFSLGLRTPPRYALDGTAARQPGRTLSAIPNDVLIGIIGSGSVRANLYRSASPRDPEVFRRDHRIELVGERRLRAGDQLLLRACEDVLDVVEVDGDVAMVELALTNALRIVWNYDAETLAARFASSGSVDATRMEFALELFRIFEDKASLPHLGRIAREYTHHWVRWKAVKTMLQLDLAAGLTALDGAVDDAHPHVRNAARATLQNLRNANLVS
jgi:hypothetical protein